MNTAKKLRLETWAFFMFGLPGETKNTINKTIDFAQKIDPDIAKFHILKPFPGTEVYHYFSSNGLLITKNYDKYGIHQPPVHRLPDLDEIEMLDLQKRAYKKFYFRPKKVIQQILRMKSLNRLKLNLTTSFAFLRKLFA